MYSATWNNLIFLLFLHTYIHMKVISAFFLILLYIALAWLKNRAVIFNSAQLIPTMPPRIQCPTGLIVARMRKYKRLAIISNLVSWRKAWGWYFPYNNAHNHMEVGGCHCAAHIWQIVLFIRLRAHLNRATCL